MKGPEEVEVEVVAVVVAVQRALRTRVCKMCVTGTNADVSVPLALLTARRYQHVPALLSQRRKRRKGKPPWA